VPSQRRCARRRYSRWTAAMSSSAVHLEEGALLQARAADGVEVGEVGEALEADGAAVAVDLVGVARAVGDAAGEAHVVVLRLGLHRGDDPVHRVDRVEVVGGDDQRAVGVLERRREAAADDVAEDVEDHDVGVVEEVVLLEELHGLADDVAAAAGARRRPAGLDAHHAAVALVDEVLGAQLLGVEVDVLQHVDHGRHQLLGQGEGRVVLGVAADLQDALAEPGEGDGEVRGGRRLADAALAVDGEDLGALDALGRVEADLDGAFAVLAVQDRGSDVERAHGVSYSAAISAGAMPSRRSSSSSAPAQRLEGGLVGRPVGALVGLDQAVGDAGRGLRVQLGEAAAHGVVEDEGLGEALVDPGVDLAGGGRPAHGVGHLRLDLADALVAVLEQALVPFRVEGAGAGLERDLLLEGADAGRRRGSGRRCRPASRRRRGRASRRGRCRRACRNSGRRW
jgi:hypothetical protein